MKSVCYLIIVSVCLSAQAQTQVPTSTYDTPKPVHLLVTTGIETRPEKDAQGSFTDHQLSNFNLGFGYQSFVFLLEQAQYQDRSGNSTLSVERLQTDYLLWSHYRAMSWNRLVPYLGAGLGFYQEKVTTQFAGSISTNNSKAKFLGGVAFGVGMDTPYLWLSAEARLLAGDEWDPQSGC